MDERPDPAQLAAAVKEMPDEQVSQAISDMGVDAVLQQIFDGMQERFLPDRARGVDATVQYDIDTPEGTKTWSVSFVHGSCKVEPGATADPRLRLSIALVDFVRLIFGQADGTQLFMSGKLRLQGDMMFAMQMQNFFDRRL